MTDNDSTAGTDTSEQQAADVALLREAAAQFGVHANEAAKRGSVDFAEMNNKKSQRLKRIAAFIEENGIFFPSAPGRDWDFDVAVAAAVERGKEQILANIASGQVPGGVNRFAALQFYGRDEYGAPFPSHLGRRERTKFVYAVQDGIDKWLRDGGAKMVGV